MTIRVTTRKLTGYTTRNPEVVLGTREEGGPGVTVHFGYKVYGCFDDPEALQELITDLNIALRHLRSEA